MLVNRVIGKLGVLILIGITAPIAWAGIQVGNDQQLRAAFEQTEDTTIILEAGIRFEPVLPYDISLGLEYRLTTDRSNPAVINGNNASQGNAFNVSADSGLRVDYAIVEDFNSSAFRVQGERSHLTLHGVTCRNNGSNQAMGGCVNLDAISEFKAIGSHFNGNQAFRGGDIYGTAARIEARNNQFKNSTAIQSGGVFSITPLLLDEGFSLDDRGVWIEQNLFEDFGAGFFGGAIELNDSFPANFALLAVISIMMNEFRSISGVPVMEVPFLGYVLFAMNSVYTMGEFANNRGRFVTAGNAIAMGVNNNVVNSATTRAACNAFGSGQFLSFGFNILGGSQCPFNQPTDQLNTDPGFILNQPRLSLAANSPAVEAQGSEGLIGLPTMISNVLPEEQFSEFLPCGVADASGLGRPQDANGDGVFECDIGARELRNGPDIGAAYTMAVFDPERNGEGQFIEVLANGLAVVSFFSFGVNGGLDWFIGVGEQVGNTIVLDDVIDTTGGRWGSAFNPNNIVRTTAGKLSLVFPTCEAISQPGRFMFQAATGSGRPDLFNVASRITATAACDGVVSNPNSVRTGGYFGGPSRNGEGIQYFELSTGQALAIFYGFDPNGNKFWTLSAGSTRNGNTVTLPMVYPESTTEFGSNFDPNEVGLAPFGEMRLTFNANGTVDFSMVPSLAGFEAVSYNMVKLSQPIGLQ